MLKSRINQRINFCYFLIKDPSGYAITICGRGSYPIEEISGLENTTDYAITTAGKNDEFWNKYLLDDRKKVQKRI